MLATRLGSPSPTYGGRRTYAQFAAGFGIATTTAYRHVTEAVGLLAALAAGLTATGRTALVKACLILDGTLLPIDCVATDRPFCMGKRKKRGMNVQVIADPFGRLLWASPALPGAVHDPRAARGHGILHARTATGIPRRTDKAYQGASGTARAPYWGRWETLLAGQKAANRSYAKPRVLVEQAIATLKSWRLLRKQPCSTTRTTTLVQAVLTHLTSSQRMKCVH
ncbi:IS5 family transposase [Streptomyces spectabilis]|uniref:DDE Tnp4 domain-containing protein n=1 Tax=Streptomyces spectabilis TaxID=68270 RepID=A0A7W8EY99_STRST|nr:hypothetical protein [Streptomyces spectabilis]GGV55216.1 IS5 family transposase [Streptomyces spectabilis]